MTALPCLPYASPLETALTDFAFSPPRRSGASATRRGATGHPRLAARATIAPRPWLLAGLFVGLLVGLATGCPGGPQGPDIGRLPRITSADPQAEAELGEARAADEAGETETAEARYRAFIAAHPRDPLRPVAELGLGRQLLARGAYAEAREIFDNVAGHADRSIAEQGRFQGAIAAHHLGDHVFTVSTLSPMIGRTIAAADTSLLLRTLSASQRAMGDMAGAITTLDLLASEREPPADVAAAREALRTLIEKDALPATVVQLTERLPRDGPGWAVAARRAVRDAHAAREVDRTRQLLSAMREQELSLDEELQEIAMRAAQPSDANPRAIGVILSLSGRARQVGELSLRGIMLAAGLPPKGPQAPDAPQVIFRDDAGDPAKALAAVDELVTVHRVIAIIGPMDGHCAQLASLRAQELGVPMITLTPAGSVTTRGHMIFRMFPTPVAEAAALIAGARATRPTTRFAVLHPETPYGLAMRDAFLAALDAAGLEPAAIQAYPGTATAFGAELSSLAKHDFDALYVADHAARLALIAPALAAADMWSADPAQAPAERRNIQLLAPSVAYAPGLARSAGRYLQGALFSVPFDASTARGAAGDFAERYQSEFGARPDAFAAFAHDAYQLVRSAVSETQPSRAALARQLLQQRLSAAAGPSTGFDRSREPRRATQLLRLRGDAFEPAE